MGYVNEMLKYDLYVNVVMTVQAHQRLKITKEHTIKPKEDGELETHTPAAAAHHKSLFCSVHLQVTILSYTPIFCK